MRHLRALEEGDKGWNDLLTEGLVEYIDCEEEESTMIAMTVNDVLRNQESSAVCFYSKKPKQNKNNYLCNGGIK